MTLNHTPQTFEEWCPPYTQFPHPLMRGCMKQGWDAGVASQQVEIEYHKGVSESRWIEIQRLQAEIERLKAQDETAVKLWAARDREAEAERAKLKAVVEAARRAMRNAWPDEALGEIEDALAALEEST